MNVTVYVPKELEPELRRRAKAARLSPSLLIQSVLRESLGAGPARFSAEFAALAGSWEDDRSPTEIIQDIRANGGPCAVRS